MTAVPPRPAAPSVIREVPAACICADEDDCTSCPVCTRPAAPDATAGDGLRSVLIEDVKTALDAAYHYSNYRWPQQQDCHRIADDLLGGHALRDVLAAAARDAEKVRAVRGLIDGEFDYSSLELRRAIRRALDPS